MRQVWAWALGLLLVAWGHSGGGVVFDSGPPSLSDCAPSDFDEPLPPVPGPIQAAGMLAFDVPTLVTDFHWWGVYLLDDVPPERDSFTLRFFHLPPDEYPDISPWWEASAGHVSRTDTGLRLETWMAPEGETFALYHYAWYDPVGVVVPAGEHILSIVNDTESVPDNWCWAEADSHPYFHL